MLLTLSIRDVVLISRLDLSFQPGLSVLTGETGAGKSILLDALGLALGSRAESRLVRHGARQAVVTAEFILESGHPARALLEEHGIDGDSGSLLLRRMLGADGRSRAFVNDQSVSVSLLKSIGQTCVELHGQFESQRLLDPSYHRVLLDAYGRLDTHVQRVGEAWATWSRAAAARSKAVLELEAARRDEEYLRHAVDEFERLAPEPGEEARLAADRALLMSGEKLLEAMNQAAAELDIGAGVEAALQAALGHLERASGKAEGSLDEVIAALERASAETAEGVALLEKSRHAVDLDPRTIESVEERLFALRALARKHGTDVEQLPRLLDRLTADLGSIEDGAEALERLSREEAAAKAGYVDAAGKLSAARRRAAARMDKAVAGEMKPLKLGKAEFSTRIETVAEADWGEQGCDRVAFLVSTNPGSPPGPLNKIASGGELARFMLALKVVLAGTDSVFSIVFDEVDSGVGGAVASAVGRRLARIAEDIQVLVVTHSPQVAAEGAHHWLVTKSEADSAVLTDVNLLTDDERKEEIARMLAGERVTDEARAAAGSLLGGNSR
jgi:DNA repair protein RecN (Recombination protein N)